MKIVKIKQKKQSLIKLKKRYKKTTQKFECGAMINIFNYIVTKNQMEHNHPISQDCITYAIHRKQDPNIMDKIYTLLASGLKDPFSNVML